MEHELNGMKRTFPKKRQGEKQQVKFKAASPKKRRRANPNASSIPACNEVDGVLVTKKKPKKGSKARRRLRAAKFAAKIEVKKKAAAAATEAAEQPAREAVEHHDAGQEHELIGDEIELEAAGSSCIPFIHHTRELIMNDAPAEEEDSEEGMSTDEKEAEQDEEKEEVDSESGISDDKDAFRAEIANMPMGKVRQLKERIGIRLFNKAFFGKTTEEETSMKAIAKSSNQYFIRDNPKRPREMSSKRPVSKFRNIFTNERIEKERFDPRFDERCGPYDEYIHRSNYAFLDEMRQHEKRVLEKEIQKTKKEGVEGVEKMKETLRRINNREKSLAEKKRYKEVIREIRRENNERMHQGKKPVFLKRGEVKLRVMEKKFEELKKTNKLDNYLERKAKKRNRKDSQPV